MQKKGKYDIVIMKLIELMQAKKDLQKKVQKKSNILIL